MSCLLLRLGALAAVEQQCSVSRHPRSQSEQPIKSQLADVRAVAKRVTIVRDVRGEHSTHCCDSPLARAVGYCLVGHVRGSDVSALPRRGKVLIGLGDVMIVTASHLRALPERP